MAGPVPSYLSTQTAAQTAFTVPFGLLSFVNAAIASATAAGEFNVTVDCSLFVTEDVSNLRIYLDSLGYGVEFAKNSNDKSLNIDWGRFLDIPGTEVVVDQGTTPWIVAGTVTANQGTSPWVVTGTISTSPDVNVHDGVGNPIGSVGGSLDANVTNFPASFGVTQDTSPWVIDGSVTVTNFPAVQPVSGTVTANIGTTGGLALDATLTSGGQKSQIVNSSFVSVDARQIGDTPVDTDVGLITNSVIYGHTTAGGGSYVEVKVTPSGAIAADVSGSSVTVSGTVTANQGTSPWTVDGTVNVGNFPASQNVVVTNTPTVNQGTSPWVVSGSITTSPDVNIHDSSGNPLSSTGTSLNTNVTNTVTVTGPLTDTQLRATPVPISGTVTANAGSGNFTVVQPSGASLHVDVDNFPAIQPVSGTVTANQGTSPWVVGGTVAATQSGAWTTGRTWTLINTSDSVAAVQSGAWTTGRTWTLSNGTDSVAAVQSGSWTVAGTGNFTVVQPTGTNLHTVLDSGTLTSITNALPAGTNVIGHVITDTGSTTMVTGNVTVVQPTGTNLHTVVDSGSITVNNGSGASAVNIQDGGNSITVDGTVTVNQGTSPWVVGGTVAATQSGAWTTGRTWTLASGTDSIAAVQSGTWTVQPGNTPNTAPWLMQQRPTTLTTYSATIVGLVAAATPTDIFTIYGSGTKIVKITLFQVTAIQNTAATRDLLLIKRSATNTGGTSAAVTAISHDSTNAAATATVLSYTANPAALGAAVGTIRASKVQIMATNVTNAIVPVTWDFGTRPVQPVVLHGTAEGLALNLNSVTSSSNSFDIFVEWTEE